MEMKNGDNSLSTPWLNGKLQNETENATVLKEININGI